MNREFLENISREVVELYAEMETELLNNIAKKVGANKELFLQIEDNPALINDWQLDRLKQLDGLTKENAKIIASQSGKTVKEIENIFDQAIENGLAVDDTLLLKGVEAGILKAVPKISESLILKNALQVGINSTKTTFNKINNTMLDSTQRAFVDTINRVSTNILAGLDTPQQASLKALRQLSSQGLTAYVADNGAQWSPEAYTNMLVRTNVKNTINNVQDLRIQKAGGNYIEINSYSGARPLCSEDQGQVFSLNGNTTPIKDLNGNTIRVRSWFDSTHGQPAGILGINCGHQKFMFVPSISSYERNPIPQKENDERYQERQQQRYLERQIRQAKRDKSVLESSTMVSKQDLKKAQEKITLRQQQMRQFIKENDLNRNYAREQIK
jgi:hypothetical protein